VTATIPAQQSNRDSLAIADALATLIAAGFTVSANAILTGADGTEVRITLAQGHHPIVRMSTVFEGVHTNQRYETHHMVDGVQVPFDTQSAVEFAAHLVGASTLWEVTR
jgi:hypothetical protein